MVNVTIESTTEIILVISGASLKMYQYRDNMISDISAMVIPIIMGCIEYIEYVRSKLD